MEYKRESSRTSPSRAWVGNFKASNALTEKFQISLLLLSFWPSKSLRLDQIQVEGIRLHLLVWQYHMGIGRKGINGGQLWRLDRRAKLMNLFQHNRIFSYY